MNALVCMLACLGGRARVGASIIGVGGSRLAMYMHAYAGGSIAWNAVAIVGELMGHAIVRVVHTPYDEPGPGSGPGEQDVTYHVAVWVFMDRRIQC